MNPCKQISEFKYVGDNLVILVPAPSLKVEISEYSDHLLVLLSAAQILKGENWSLRVPSSKVR